MGLTVVPRNVVNIGIQSCTPDVFFRMVECLSKFDLERRGSVKAKLLYTYDISREYFSSRLSMQSKCMPDWNFCLAQGINPPRTSTISHGCSRAIYIKIIHLAAMINAAVFLLNVQSLPKVLEH